MEIEAIISSGILELYATGILPGKEAFEVEKWIKQFPSVASELKAIMTSLEAYAQINSILPSSFVKKQVLAEINKKNITPLVRNRIETGRESGDRWHPIVFWRSIAASALFFLVVSVLYNIIFFRKYFSTGKYLFTTQKTLTESNRKYDEMASVMNVVQNKFSLPVILKEVGTKSDAAIKIFWITNTGDIFLDITNLQAEAPGKKYQLWGIVKNKPVNAGMILPGTKTGIMHFQKMKPVKNAEAFAVSLETDTDNVSPKGPIILMSKI